MGSSSSSTRCRCCSRRGFCSCASGGETDEVLEEGSGGRDGSAASDVGEAGARLALLAATASGLDEITLRFTGGDDEDEDGDEDGGREGAALGLAAASFCAVASRPFTASITDLLSSALSMM